eukprot:TRINITY_DN2674_c0_g1_i1.p1 TRINITY_DN2674_c0_g1~~TRINITY_DN2674_c0_g1_i1.p1  ORF type:complete len:411 (-),score=72.53 TRINITY_DN2674_c0_g1_i1:29-1261(-)
MVWVTVVLTVAVVGAVAVAVLLWVRGRKPAPVKRAPPLLRTTPYSVTTAKTGLHYAVTGGHGFLGSHVVEGLLARGEEHITILDVLDCSLFAPEREKNPPTVTFIRCNITDKHAVTQALKDVDVVIHTAAIVHWWCDLPHEYGPSFAVNVGGTKNLLAAAKEQRVRKFLHTSSCSVVLGKDILSNPISGGDESIPYPKDSLSHYMGTKLLAEKAVLEANDKLLMTGAVRPGGIYGPRDIFLVRATLENPVTLITPQAEQDMAYVENVVHGLFKLEEKMTPSSPVCGRAYFITDAVPGSVLKFMQSVVKAADEKMVLKELPYKTMWALAYVCHLLAWLTTGRLSLGAEIGVLRPATMKASQGVYWFKLDKARNELGYEPAVPQDTAIRRSVEYYAREKAQATAATASKKTQ